MTGMIVLGFDPGTASTGWGAIEQEGNRLCSLGHGCIVTSAKDPTHVRLRQIYDQARGLIQRFQAGGHRLRPGEQDPGAGDDQGHPVPAAHPAA